MKRTSSITSLAAGALLFVLASAGFGQAPDGPPDGPGPAVRANALRDLGLSREQALQIRRINQERRSSLDAAHQRLRQAMQALDQAIYADQTDEASFKAKLADFQAAQTEVTALRFEKELAIRKVLTAEQVVRFREIRRKFQELREDRQEFRREHRPPDQRPFMKPGKQRPPV